MLKTGLLQNALSTGGLYRLVFFYPPGLRARQRRQEVRQGSTSYLQPPLWEKIMPAVIGDNTTDFGGGMLVLALGAFSPFLDWRFGIHLKTPPGFCSKDVFTNRYYM